MIDLVVIFAVACMATSSIGIRASTAPSIWLALMRMLLSCLILLPMVVSRYRKEIIALTKKQLLCYALSGVTLGCHFLCYFESVKYTSIASSVVLTSTEVFIVALGAWAIFGERISAKGLASVLFTFIGCVIVATAQISSARDVGRGNLLAFAASAFASINTLFGRYGRKSTSSTVYTFVVYSFAALTLLCGTLLSDVPLVQEPVNWLCALWLAVVCTMLGHSLLSYSLRYKTAAYIASAKLLIPFFAALCGWLVLGEVPTVQVLVGSVIIVGGVYVYTNRCQKSC